MPGRRCRCLARGFALEGRHLRDRAAVPWLRDGLGLIDQAAEIEGLLATGVWSSTDELAATWQEDRRFSPAAGARNDGRLNRWREAVSRSVTWEC